MIKIALCDDQSDALAQILKILRDYLKSTTEAVTIDCFTSGHKLLAATRDHHFDIFILDIILPEMDGIALAKSLRENDKECLIIFLSTSSDYALKSYEVNAFQYLLKPLDPKKLCAILDEIFPLLLRRQTKRIMVTTPKGITTVKVYDITFVEHFSHVLYIHLKNADTIPTANSTLSLSDLESQLDQIIFLRPHRGFLVNLYCIATLTSDSFVLEDGSIIPIAGRRYGAVKQEYLNFLLHNQGGLLL